VPGLISKLGPAKQLTGPVSHSRWCRQIENWLQHRSVQEPLTAQTALQDRNPSSQTRLVSELQVPSESARVGGLKGLAPCD
jgi:hypothetical protein